MDIESTLVVKIVTMYPKVGNTYDGELMRVHRTFQNNANWGGDTPIFYFLKYGWSVDEIINTPKNKHRRNYLI